MPPRYTCRPCRGRVGSPSHGHADSPSSPVRKRMVASAAGFSTDGSRRFGGGASSPCGCGRDIISHKFTNQARSTKELFMRPHPGLPNQLLRRRSNKTSPIPPTINAKDCGSGTESTENSWPVWPGVVGAACRADAPKRPANNAGNIFIRTDEGVDEKQCGDDGRILRKSNRNLKYLGCFTFVHFVFIWSNAVIKRATSPKFLRCLGWSLLKSPK